VKTIGCATTQHEIKRLEQLAREEMNHLSGNQLKFFGCESDEIIEQAFSLLDNSSIHTVGAELIFGKIYDYIGFNGIEEELFKHLVIARLSFPLSKLKMDKEQAELYQIVCKIFRVLQCGKTGENRILFFDETLCDFFIFQVHSRFPRLLRLVPPTFFRHLPLWLLEVFLFLGIMFQEDYKQHQKVSVHLSGMDKE